MLAGTRATASSARWSTTATGGWSRWACLSSSSRTSGKADRLAAAEELARGEGWLTVKHDGVLVIRSVIRGRVVFRTRGSFDGEHHGRAIEQIAREHYPALCDPEWMAGHSVHLEYVTPAHRIIVRYPEPDLVLIGATANETLERLSPRRAARPGRRPPPAPTGGGAADRRALAS